MYDNIESLATATMYQAAKDYVCTKNKGYKGKIIKDLKGDWMLFLTNGQSEVVADALLKNPEGIRQRIAPNKEVN